MYHAYGIVALFFPCLIVDYVDCQQLLADQYCLCGRSVEYTQVLS